MAYTSVNPFVVGESLTKVMLDTLWNNAAALKEARRALTLGGDPNTGIEDTALVYIPGVVFAEIDGTNLAGLTVDVHVMTMADTGTGYVRLYNVSDAVNVGSEVAFSNNVPALVKITGLTLAVGIKQYALKGRGSIATAFPRYWGAQLITR